MNHSAKKFLGTGLALGLAALNLCAQSASQFGNLPLWFEAGQPTKFTAHASDSEFIISSTGAEFTLAKKTGETAGCQLQFVGANPAARISGDQKLTGTINYLLGRDPGQWQANVPTFAQVRVENIYPGVNVLYYGNRQKLEYDFNLAVGVNPSVIALRFDGAEKISLDAQGGLIVSFNSGEVLQHPPVAYQTVHGARLEVTAGYKILDVHTAAFVLGNYNHNEPLVIDPVLSYSSYFGGNYGDTAWAIAVNTNNGSIYVAGQTFSTKDTNNSSATFSTPGAFQTNYQGGRLTGDAFVARFGIESDADGTGTNLHLIYATYLGGSGNDGALGLAVDPNGDAFVTGFTDSTNFPTTNSITETSGLYPHISGGVDKFAKTHLTDAFVAELNTNGDALIYSTYLGGNSMDAAYGIALDESGNAYVTGYTYSTNFPCTTNTAYQFHLMCSNTFYINANAFVAEISTGGMSLNYSTFLGGTNYDVGRAIAYNNGMLFVAGNTFSTNFPTTNYLQRQEFIYTDTFTNTMNHHLQTNTIVWTNVFTGQYLNGYYSTNKTKARRESASDAFVTAFDTTVTTNLILLYSTFLGGTNDDQANGIAADADGNAYVVGWTVSTNFPYTNALSGFATNSLSYVHTNGVRFVDATNGFLTKIEWDGTNASIGYSVMFGGKGRDVANGVALDSANNVYIVGSASSTNFPIFAVTTNTFGFSTTNNSDYKGHHGGSDAFVIAFTNDCSGLIYSAYLGGKQNDFGNAIAVDQFDNAYIVGQTLSTNFPASIDSSNSISALHRNGSNDMFISIISTNSP